VIGQTQTNCGPFFDDAEITRGWQVNPDGTDTATAGRFARGNPEPTTYAGVRMQPSGVTSGRAAWITGLPVGASAGSYDLDGRSSIRSVPIALPATPGELSLNYTFAHGPGTTADKLEVYVEDEAATRTLVWSTSASSITVGAKWHRLAVPLTTWAGTSVRIVIVATDGGPGTIMEIGIDDIRVERAT
jgi:MAM domain, meprin/A5/mu